MKKFLMCAVAMLFMGSVAATAQTPEEKQASDERIAVLKADRPKDCGVKEIDDVVAKCKTIADATVAIADATAVASGEKSLPNGEELLAKVESTIKELTDVGTLMGGAASALTSVKNPLKLKSATKSLNYAKDVVAAASEELPYQAKLIKNLIAGN